METEIYMENGDIEELIQHETLLAGIITVKWASVGDKRVHLRHAEEIKLKDYTYYTYEEIENKFKRYCAKYAPTFIAERHLKLVQSLASHLLGEIEKTPWGKLSPELQAWSKEAKGVLKNLKKL